MTSIHTATQLFKTNKRGFLNVIFNKLNRKGLLHWMSDYSFLRINYWLKMGKTLDFSQPKTFNEKLQWLKFYDHRLEYITMVDKVTVKDYVAKRIGDDYIIPTLGVWEKLEDVDWDSLPEKFVIKWNHNSGSVVICKDKHGFDRVAAVQKLSYGAKVNGFWFGREWPYKGVKPLLLAEQYMEDEPKSKNALVDYKFMCFNGEVKCCFTCTDRFTKEGLKVTFYDNDWNIMPFERNYPKETIPMPRPYCYDEMKAAAEKLSEGLPFARIDFYEIKKRPYFGEITFYPGCGYEAFQPEEWDYTLGSWINLPDKTR